MMNVIVFVKRERHHVRLTSTSHDPNLAVFNRRKKI